MAEQKLNRVIISTTRRRRSAMGLVAAVAAMAGLNGRFRSDSKPTATPTPTIGRTQTTPAIGGAMFHGQHPGCTGKRRRRRQRARAVAAACVAALITGCEARTFTASRPDGTVITYQRATFMGDSHSEGVSVSKQGEDLTVDVGATGSEARLEAVGKLLDIAADIAK